MIRIYKMTGFYPSGNPFLNYYDESKNTIFSSSLSAKIWDAQPEIGDIVEMHYDKELDLQKVLINGKIVFKYSKEKKKELEAHTKALYDAVKISKGIK